MKKKKQRRGKDNGKDMGRLGGVQSFSQSLVCKILIAAKYIFLPPDYCKNPSIQGTKQRILGRSKVFAQFM
jgi:hypothetical protein